MAKCAFDLGKKCSALTGKRCKKCAFFKTKEALEEGRAKAWARVQHLSSGKYVHIIRKYYPNPGGGE